LTLAFLVVVPTACGGSSTAPSNPSAGASPAAPARITVTGRITNRVDGSPISGSTITFKGIEAKSGQVTDGAYSVPDLPAGSYEVTIAGQSHVEHKTLRAQISANMPFSVLEWNSCREDVCFDQAFLDYFEWIGRGKVSAYGRVKKWATPPTELWVINRQHSLSGAAFLEIGPDAFDEFMTLLNEVNTEVLPSMYCGLTGPLKITVHEPTQQQYQPGIIIVRFQDSAHSYAGRNVTSDGVILAASAVYYAGPLRGSHAYPQTGPRDQRKFDIAHELFHDAFADHASDFYPYSRGLMSGPNDATALSSQERLAACIVYESGTKPGNSAPDTNPVY